MATRAWAGRVCLNLKRSLVLHGDTLLSSQDLGGWGRRVMSYRVRRRKKRKERERKREPRMGMT